MARAPRVLILAGPNGVGKTSLAREFLVGEADCPNFINADLIAGGLSPFAPEAASLHAGRLMLKLMAEYVRKGESFAFETTLADRTYARSIRRWRDAGYHVSLWFLSLPSPEMAIARVAFRVRQGGHAIPSAVVRRRFRAGRRNFDTLYRGLVDDWALYDNSGPRPLLVDWGQNR